MATRNQQPDLTVLEYGRLMDTIYAGVDNGDHYFHVNELAETADLTDAQVHEAMKHLGDKHQYITDAGGGRWKVSPEADV